MWPCTSVPDAERHRDHVRDAAAVEIDHLLDGHSLELPGVEGLPAGRRVERRAVEHEGRATVLIDDLTDVGRECREVGVGVVEAAGH